MAKPLIIICLFIAIAVFVTTSYAKRGDDSSSKTEQAHFSVTNMNLGGDGVYTFVYYESHYKEVIAGRLSYRVVSPGLKQVVKIEDVSLLNGRNEFFGNTLFVGENGFSECGVYTIEYSFTSYDGKVHLMGWTKAHLHHFIAPITEEDDLNYLPLSC